MQPYRLQIPRPHFEAMLAHARHDLPHECCGFLAGTLHEGIAIVEAVTPLINALASPIAYEADVRSLLHAHKAMRASGLREVAVFHSHPTSAPVPSKTDLKNNGYGTDLLHLIIGLLNAEPVVRAWVLHAQHFEEATLEWIEPI